MNEMLCGCLQCLRDRKNDNPPGSGWPTELTIMILCPTCRNKRCPHATDHRHACTGSNEPGQDGSAYKGCKRCNGTGTASAARDSGTENAHWSQVQYGLYRCSTCNGTGKLGLTAEDEERMREAIRKVAERMSSNAGIHRAPAGRPVE